MPAYYNEHDAKKAAWLRELIRRDLIAPGEVDERSIEVIKPEELRGFDQCHFFAGIGVWSYALRNAGWADNAPVWTGSCPCPSFSQSGKGEGFDDPRHLWPAWFRLLRICRPNVVFGEQVASDSALAWLDLVSSDLEGEGYALGAADLCAAGVGAPHIRQRLYFVADHSSKRLEKQVEQLRPRAQQLPPRAVSGSVEHPAGDRHARRARKAGTRQGEEPSRPTKQRHGASDLVGDPQSERRREAGRSGGRSAQRTGDASEPSELGDSAIRGTEGPSLNRESGSGRESQVAAGGSGLSDFWGNLVWLPCRDGKARPVESGTFPLAHGAPERVVRLRGYGDAIVAPLAQAFVEAYCEVRAA